MKRCPDSDRLVDLAAALEWRPDEFLAHVWECEDCRVALRRQSALQSLLAHEIEPAPGFSKYVVRQFANSEAGKTRGGVAALLGLINPILAGATAFFAVALAYAGVPRVDSLTAMLLASVVAAVSVLVWSRLSRVRLAQT